jgi:hypothetical protein
LQNNRANQTNSALVGFCKIVCQLNNANIKFVERFVLGLAAGVQMNRVRHIPSQEQMP